MYCITLVRNNKRPLEEAIDQAKQFCSQLNRLVAFDKPRSHDELNALLADYPAFKKGFVADDVIDHLHGSTLVSFKADTRVKMFVNSRSIIALLMQSFNEAITDINTSRNASNLLITVGPEDIAAPASVPTPKEVFGNKLAAFAA